MLTNDIVSFEQPGPGGQSRVGTTILYHLINADLAQYEIFHTKVCVFWQGWYKLIITGVSLAFF